MATRYLKLKVTQEQADMGIKKSSSFCPVALALRNLGFSEVSVGVSESNVVKKNYWQRFLLPNALKEQISNFDSGGKFKPGNYYLEYSGQPQAL